MSNQLKTRAIVNSIDDRKGRLYAIAVADPVFRETVTFVEGGVKNAQELLANYDPQKIATRAPRKSRPARSFVNLPSAG